MRLIELINRCFLKDNSVKNLKFKFEGYDLYVKDYVIYFKDSFGFERELKTIDIYKLNYKIRLKEIKGEDKE